MKKTFIFLSFLLLALFCAGCGKTAPAGTLAATEICERGTYNIDNTPLPFPEQDLFEQLFSLNNKLEIRIDMDETELAKLQADYEQYSSFGSKSPIYRMADVTISVTTPEGNRYNYLIPQVGVRMKGNTSRTDFYSPEEGIYNQIHLKLSFQETFDEAKYYGNDSLSWEPADREIREKRTFATLEKLDLRWNKCADSTYIKELYAYEIYRDQGVPAPHMNLSCLTWAGMDMGIYSINEPVDKIFLQKNLPARALGGDLYKCGWAGSRNGSFTPTDSIGIEDEDLGMFYAYDLKTNKKTSGNERLIHLISLLNNGAVSAADLEKLIDLENFLGYCAVSWLVGNPDDMRNNYNNFYLYFRADNGKALFIPYDCDRCFGITMHWNPTGTGCTDDDPFSTERLAVDYRDTGADRSQRNPLILYTVARGGYFTREYAHKLETIAAGKWMQPETFLEYFRTADALYGEDAIPDREFRNNPDQDYRFDPEKTSDFASTDNISFREYAAAKLETLERYLIQEEHNADPIVISPYCIRADFTNWEIHSDHIMQPEDGIYVYYLEADSLVRLKVYDNFNDRWYGTECLSEHSYFFDTDDHTNIILLKGSYIIRFDPGTGLVEVQRNGG